MITERIIVITVTILAAAGVYVMWRVYARVRLKRLKQQCLPASVLNIVQKYPTVLYFTTPNCAQCRRQQTPILQRLSQQMSIAVQIIDATVHEDIARHFGVMTVPTTVVLNRHRQPVAINHGLATQEQLIRQLTTGRL